MPHYDRSSLLDSPNYKRKDFIVKLKYLLQTNKLYAIILKIKQCQPKDKPMTAKKTATAPAVKTPVKGSTEITASFSGTINTGKINAK